MKFIKLLLFIPLYIGCNSNPSGNNPASNKGGLDTTTDIYSVAEEDPSMNLAIDKAKQTIAEFDKALKTGNPLYDAFAIKKRYNSPDGGGEHMWIGGISIENGNYKGVVNNDAEKTTEVKYGDTVIVRKDEITDWMYLDNNVLKGGYTIREIRNQLNKEDRIKMDKELGFIIED